MSPRGIRSRAEGLALPLCLFLLYAALHLTLLWKWYFFPYHDTLQLFQLFHTNYRNILLHGAMAEWVPYGNYGMPSYVKDITGFTPLSYAAFAVGRLFGATDSWPLFVASLAAEVLVFAVGLHAFCRLFLSRFGSLVTALAFLLTSPLWWNYAFQFRAVYLVPAASWLMVTFFRTGALSALAVSGILLLLSGFGQAAYMVLMYALYFVILGIAVGFAYRRHLRVRFDGAAFVTLPLAVAFTAATAYIFSTTMRHVAFVAQDRDPTTLQVDLSMFLRYGSGGISKVLETVIAVPVLTGDVFFHVTTVALVLAAYACLRERSRDFLAIAGAFVVLLVFCFGPYSPVAYLLYYVPGMAYFRHVGLMYAFPRLLLALMAGFGADRFLASLATSDGSPAGQQPRREVAMLAVLGGSIGAVAMAALGHGSLILAVMAGASIAGFVILALVALRVSVRTLPTAVSILILAQGTIYMASFTLMAYRPGSMVDDIGLIAETPFEERRRVSITDHPLSPLLQFLDTRGVTYTEVSPFLGLDSCWPIGRVDMFAPGVVELARLRFGPDVNLRELPRIWLEHASDHFFRVLTCDAARLQLVASFTERALAGDAAAAPHTVGAGAILMESPGGDRRLITPPGGEYPAAATLREQGLVVTGHSDNHVSVAANVASSSGAWLIYADGYHPFWRAQIDGAPATVWRADLAVKAVRVPPGQHSVTFRFGDPVRHALVWTTGLGGALLSLVVAVYVAACSSLPAPR